jgi:hypothetical protein
MNLRVLLRRKIDSHFFVHSGEWTPNKQCATNFRLGATAIRKAAQLGLLNKVEVVLSYDEPTYDLVHPLGGKRISI